MKYFFKRVLSMIPVLFIVTVVLFLLMHLIPGSPASSILGLDASPADIEALNKALGYDQPIFTQYILWMKNVLHGDLGDSIFMNQPVATAIREHIVPTLRIAILAEIMALLIAIPIGICSAYYHDSPFDNFFNHLSLLKLATPSFLLALLLMLFFGNHLQWLPVSGYKPIRDGFWASTRYLILPALSIAIVQSAQFMRVTRTAVLNTLHQPYIKTARAKGASEFRVVMKHALQNASLPILTTIGQSFGFLIAGSVVVESIFVIPGMGQLMINAIRRRDIPVIQGTVLVIAMLYIVINLLVDLLYLCLDKRIKLD